MGITCWPAEKEYPWRGRKCLLACWDAEMGIQLDIVDPIYVLSIKPI